MLNFEMYLKNILNETIFFVSFLSPLVDNMSIVKKEYIAVLIFLIFAIILTLIILGSSYFLVKQNPEVEKLSAYECGFEPYEDSRHTFDIKFCIIAILFIIFDIEIMFLIPWSVSISKIE